MHLVYPPEFCITIVSNFSWVLQSFQEKSKTMVKQNLGGLTRCIMVYVKMVNCILVVNDSCKQFTFFSSYFKLIVVHVNWLTWKVSPSRTGSRNDRSLFASHLLTVKGNKGKSIFLQFSACQCLIFGILASFLSMNAVNLDPMQLLSTVCGRTIWQFDNKRMGFKNYSQWQ